MELDLVKTFITTTFEGSYFMESDGDLFFFYGEDNKFPFATVVTKDNEFDNNSDLNRPGVYRLNISVDKTTFQSLFEGINARSGIGGFAQSGLDFTALNRIMPHPMYGNLYWICILNPEEDSLELLRPYLSEGYARAVQKEEKRAGTTT
jgi:hypothetical protein